MRTRRLLTALLILAFGGIALYFAGLVPGTVHPDANGFMHGTGRWLYHYKNGAVRLEEHYLAGSLRRSKWFRPDGSLIAETRWGSGDRVGYYVREDGTIRTKIEFRDGLAHGQAIYYKEDGTNIDHIAEFRNGRKVETLK